MEDPERLLQEYQRRVEALKGEGRSADLETIAAQVRKLRQGMGRLIDSYAEGLIEKGDFEPRVRRLKERIAILEQQAQQVSAEASMENEVRTLIGRLQDFVGTVTGGLDQITWEGQRAIIRAVVGRVEIDGEQIQIIFRVSASPSPSGLGGPVLLDRSRRVEHHPRQIPPWNSQVELLERCQ